MKSHDHKVNTFIIGVQKGGTTWLSSILSNHSDVFVPKKKETHYFNKKSNFLKGNDWYHKHFNFSKHKIIMDCTPNYFWHTSSMYQINQSKRNKNIPKLIKGYSPEAKLILTFRNPVERAISAYYHHIRSRRISPNQNITDVMNEYGILSMGYYYEQLNEWLKYFSLDNILILIFEDDILKNKEKTIHRISNFLDIKADIDILKNNKLRKNSRGGSLYLRINYLNKFLGRIFKKLPRKISDSNLFPILVNDKDRFILKSKYNDDFKNLEKILNRKLPW